MSEEKKTRGDIAAELFMSGCNCAQAVLAAFDDVTGMDRETSLRVASTLGGGMCRLREVCGAVSGALIVLGLLEGEGTAGDHAKKAALYAKGQDFAAKFKEEMGALTCRELLELAKKGADEPTPEKRTEEYYHKRPCAEIVRFAADTLEGMIK